MGMAASQVNLLKLTARKNSIQGQLTDLSFQKIRLTSDVNKITKEYTDAINAKTLKWSNNGGTSYIDLTYKNLMNPNSQLSNNNTNLITDSSGRVVLHDDYKKYAEMISPDGKPGGDWESVKNQIIPELTGVSADKLNLYEQYGEIYDAACEHLTEVAKQEPNDDGKKNVSVTDLLKEIDKYRNANGGGGNMFENYTTKNYSTIKNGTFQKDWVNQLRGDLNNFLGEGAVDEAVDSYISMMETLYANRSNGSAALNAYSDSGTWQFAVNYILGYYSGQIENGEESDINGNSVFTIQDKNNPNYQEIHDAYVAWEEDLEAAKTAVDDSYLDFSQVFTSDEARKVEYYDKLFTAIAENGWTYNEKITDSEYLNNMLQNNLYTITTVEHDCDINGNKYTTNTADMSPNVFKVRDTDAAEEAKIRYYNKKALLSAKESRIDTRMKNLETEDSSIGTIIDSIKKVIDNNVKTSFNVTS